MGSALGHHGRILVLLTLMMGVTATAMGQPPESSTVQIQVGDNMRFTPSVIQARPGQQIHVILRNVGTKPKSAVAHNFVLLKRGTNAKAFVDKVSAPHEPDLSDPKVSDKILVATPLVGAGETAEARFQAPTRAGEYDWVCTFRGHFNLGMHGQLVVK